MPGPPDRVRALPVGTKGGPLPGGQGARVEQDSRAPSLPWQQSSRGLPFLGPLVASGRWPPGGPSSTLGVAVSCPGCPGSCSRLSAPHRLGSAPPGLSQHSLPSCRGTGYIQGVWMVLSPWSARPSAQTWLGRGQTRDWFQNNFPDRPLTPWRPLGEIRSRSQDPWPNLAPRPPPREQEEPRASAPSPPAQYLHASSSGACTSPEGLRNHLPAHLGKPEALLLLAGRQASVGKAGYGFWSLPPLRASVPRRVPRQLGEASPPASLVFLPEITPHPA